MADDALTPDERQLVGKAAWGEAADFTDRASPPVIRADVLRRLLLGLPVWPGEGGGLQRLDVPASVIVRGAEIEGPLDLDEATGASGLPGLVLEGCRLPALTARHAHIKRLVVKDCAFTRLDLAGASIDADVDLSGARALAPGTEGADGQCVVSLEGARVDGGLTMTGAHLRLTPRADLPEGETKRYALELRDAEIRGSVSLQPGFVADGGLRLMNARIEGDLRASGARLLAGEQDALQGQGAAIGGSVLLRAFDTAEAIHRFTAKGRVSLMGARIGGDLSCVGTALDGGGGDALNAQGAEIKGSVHLRAWDGKDGTHRFTAKGPVSLMGARIGGTLDCDGTELDGGGGVALNAQRAEVTGSVLLRAWDGKDGTHRFTAKGLVSLMGARIGGDLSCGGAALDGGGGDALHV